VSQVFPGIRIHCLTLDFNFRIPIFREICLAGGLWAFMTGTHVTQVNRLLTSESISGACSVSRESMNCLLSKPGGGNGVLIIPGGAREGKNNHCLWIGFPFLSTDNGTNQKIGTKQVSLWHKFLYFI